MKVDKGMRGNEIRCNLIDGDRLAGGWLNANGGGVDPSPMRSFVEKVMTADWNSVEVAVLECFRVEIESLAFVSCVRVEIAIMNFTLSYIAQTFIGRPGLEWQTQFRWAAQITSTRLAGWSDEWHKLVKSSHKINDEVMAINERQKMNRAKMWSAPILDMLAYWLSARPFGRSTSLLPRLGHRIRYLLHTCWFLIQHIFRFMIFFFTWNPVPTENETGMKKKDRMLRYIHHHRLQIKRSSSFVQNWDAIATHSPDDIFIKRSAAAILNTNNHEKCRKKTQNNN